MKCGGHGHHQHKPIREALGFRLIGGAQYNLRQRDLYSADAEFAQAGAGQFR